MAWSRVIQGHFTRRPVRPRGGVAQRVAHGDAFQIDPSTLARNGPGHTLPGEVRTKMERALGGDFSDVRIHIGPQAGSIGALAFTAGSDIYFAPGLYQPHSPRGQQLLGHELAHVLQQRQGRVRNPFGGALAVIQDHALEAEADRLGHKAAALQMHPAARPSAPKAPPAAPSVQRKPYKLIMGSYLHNGGSATGLPAEAAGHSFVAVEHPTGRRETWGFSPADSSSIKSVQGLQKMRAGVPSQVHRDDGSFNKPGVRMQSYEVSSTQAQAALAKISEYRSRQPSFSFVNRDCGVFARDVVRAAGVAIPGNGVVPPRQLHARLAAQPQRFQGAAQQRPAPGRPGPAGAAGRAPIGPPKLPGPPGR